MRVVADSSILIHLSAIRRSHLLKKLFGTVSIPEAVYSEVVIEGRKLPGSLETLEARRAGTLKVYQVVDREKVEEISEEYKMSVSNAEVIQMARETNAEIVLANEEEVRDAAASAGFKVKGCLGILIDGVKNRILSSQEAIQDIDNLVKSGYRISDDIIKLAKDTMGR